MVTSQHEAMHRIFRENPELISHHFKKINIPFPTLTEVAVIDTDMTEICPIERRADTVMMLQSLEGPLVVISEAQSSRDDKKEAAWPYYIAHAHAKYKCPIILLVICQDEETARWARLPKTIGLPGHPSLVVYPIVLAPDNVAKITTLEEATENVVTTMFSALTHARTGVVADILEVLADALDTVDMASAEHIAEQTEIGLGNTEARQLWRKLMATKTYRYQSEYAQMLRTEGEAHALLLILEGRGVVVPDAVRERITSCGDTAVIETWIGRAANATSLTDIFGVEDGGSEGVDGR